MSADDEIRIELSGDEASENLDLYALTSNLRVLNETHQGTRPDSDEAVCLELEPGAYYVMVTSVDPTQSMDAAYTLGVSSDPQTISASITNAVQPIEVGASCTADVEFTISIHDTCCLDEDNLGLNVSAALPTANATLGPVVIDSTQVLGERDIEVHGHVQISALESCPAEVVISAAAQDCLGNAVSTDDQGTSASATVLDVTAPEVTASDADIYCLWPPNHDYVCFEHDDFAPVITDNCAPEPTWELVACSSNQPDNGNGDGNTVNDCVISLDASGVCARSERVGSDKAGRRYGLGIAATDQCGNVSDTTAMGKLYVPHDQSPGLMCVAPPGP